MNQRAVRCLILVMSSWLGLSAVPAETPTEPPTIAETAPGMAVESDTDESPAAATATRDRRQSLHSKVWWNQPAKVREIRNRSDHLAQAMSTPLEGQIQLMIEVTSTLTESQRAQLVASYPKLLSRQWIRSAGRLP